MCDKKRLSSAAYWCIKSQSENTYVLFSRYIKVQHHTLRYYPVKESGYRRWYNNRVARHVWYRNAHVCWALVCEYPKRKVPTYSTQQTLKCSTTLWYLPVKESRPCIVEESTCPRPHLFSYQKIGRHPSYITFKWRVLTYWEIRKLVVVLLMSEQGNISGT